MVAEPDGSKNGPEVDPEDRKPQSDEARSAFVPPAGVEQPAPPEEEHPTSEFALPPGLSTEPPAEPEGSAFATPATYSAKKLPARLHPRVRGAPGTAPAQRSVAGPDADHAAAARG